MKLLLVAICCLWYSSTNAQHQSPCPDIFSYDQTKSQSGKWYGELNLQTEFPLAGVWIRVVLDRRVEVLGTDFAEVVTTDNKEFLIKNRNYSLLPANALRIPLFVKYLPDEPIPSVVAVRLNGRTVCPGKPVVGISHCPGLFSYNQDKVEPNRWHGVLTFDTEFELKGMWIRINLDQVAELLGNEFGEVTTEDNLSYLIANRNYTLTPGHPLQLPFWVKYSPVGLIPTVRSVRLNGRTVCSKLISENSKNEPILDYTNQEIAKYILSNKINAAPSTPTTTEYDYSRNALVSCGTIVPESTKLIIQGRRAKTAQWPWHGAMYTRTNSQLSYICGMSLISESHALTAAHCVAVSAFNKKLRDPDSLVLYFGLLNRKEFTESHVQRPRVDRITIHPDYSEREADIAVIRFKRPVRFTAWVRPICLWQGSADERYIVDRTGTVVGFGVTETGAVSDELLFADILVVDFKTCVFSNPEFYPKYTSFNTFCAGNLTQSAVCNGDSGGGMVFKRDGSEVYQLRGIVSTAKLDTETELCDYNYYAIFTDAAKYVSWIEQTMA